MLLHILPQVLLGSEPAQLEQYPLRAEVAHCAVYHLHGLVRRYPVQFPHYFFVGKTGIPQRHRIAESAAVAAKGRTTMPSRRLAERVRRKMALRNGTESRNLLPLRQRGERRCRPEGWLKGCGGKWHSTTAPNHGICCRCGSLRAGKRTKMNSEHMVILERTDSRKLSGSGRGRVSFQNGRKHIVLSFLTDLQLVTEAGRAGTESREPQDEPERSLPAHQSRPPEKRTTPKTPDARQQKSPETTPAPWNPDPDHARTTASRRQKKAPGGCSSGGSKGRRLPTLPPRLGQYHRHECV